MVIFESLHFEAVREQYLDDFDYALLQRQLMLAPGSGAVIRGSGGIRKLRWPGRGHGKRGGLRIIYCWFDQRDQLLMLDLYAKGEKADLSRAEIGELRKLVLSLRHRRDDS